MKKYATLLILMLCFAFELFAQPSTMTYQGRLVIGGTPATGSYNLSISIFNAATDGTEIWGPGVFNNVQVTNGLYNVTLTGLSASVFEGNSAYVQVTVAGTVLSPRLPLQSVPYAYKAETATTADKATTIVGGALGKVLVGTGIGSDPEWQDPSSGGAPGYAFNQIPGSIAVYPPLATEITLTSIVTSTTAGQSIKIDYALNVSPVVTANSNYTYELRLYRDATLIDVRTISQQHANAGSMSFLNNSTYFDTAISTGASTYSVRVIFTTATNVTSVTADNRSINLISF